MFRAITTWLNRKADQQRREDVWLAFQGQYQALIEAERSRHGRVRELARQRREALHRALRGAVSR